MSGFGTSRFLREEREQFRTDVHYRRFLLLFLAVTAAIIALMTAFS